MSAPRWKIDADGTVLDLTDNSTYVLLEQAAPPPDLDPQYATSVDSPADRLTSLRYKNRKITLKVRVYGATAAALESAVGAVQQKIGKLNRDAIVGGTGVGGTLQFTSPAGTVCTADVVSASGPGDMGGRYVRLNIMELVLEFECLPALRGAEVEV